MAKINICVSNDSFRELREHNSYYIDKTEMIEEYQIDRFDKVVSLLDLDDSGKR